jgi:hypothetical protein
MEWQQTIENWRRLSAEERRRVWWSLIPLRVSQSMAFEREPVELEWLENLHRAKAPRVTSKLPSES